MAEKVEIDIVAKDKASGEIKKVRVNLKEMGEQVTQLGVRMSAITTLPILGLAKWVSENEKVQASLKPIGDEFGKIRDTLAEALLPVIRDLMPSIMEVVRGIGDLAQKFADLPTGTKKSIVAFVGVVAAVWPVITMVGQLAVTVGTVQKLLGGLGVTKTALSTGMAGLGTTLTGVGEAIGAVAVPVLALGVAFAALFLVIKVSGEDALNTLKELYAIAGYVQGFVFGGGKAGAEAEFLKRSESTGLIKTTRTPAAQGVNIGGQAAAPSIKIEYINNAIDMTGAAKLQALLDPFINKNIRATGR